MGVFDPKQLAMKICERRQRRKNRRDNKETEMGMNWPHSYKTNKKYNKASATLYSNREKQVVDQIIRGREQFWKN